MTYLLVMGGLALSVCFTCGWLLVRGGTWLVHRLPRPGAAPRRKPRRAPAAKTRRARPARRTAPPDRGPGGLTRWLARRRFAPPLALLALALYGFTRLAEYGLAFRPHDPPGAYRDLVTALGWTAAILLGLALINLLAAWRCRTA